MNQPQQPSWATDSHRDDTPMENVERATPATKTEAPSKDVATTAESTKGSTQGPTKKPLGRVVRRKRIVRTAAPAQDRRSTSQRVVDSINEVRASLVRVVEELPELQSFRTLLRTSETLRERFSETRDIVRSPRVAQTCDGRMTCAVIGSSGHGKTTMLDEMFPQLSKRGWLVTDVTDTTSQSLRIQYCDPRSKDLESVTVESWDTSEIKELMRHQEVEEQNEKDGIQITYEQDGVKVDGSEAKFPPEDLAQFRFSSEVDLRPFDKPYLVTPQQAKDPRFIRALTVKEQSDVMHTGELLRVGNRSYDPLQLRAVVKSVSLKDDFEQIADWAGSERPLEDIARLTFVDTPGLATPGNAKDEVLRHFLERKSEHIALKLWENDELDIVIHMVLCGRSSDFARLWKSIERRSGAPGMDSLEERLILAVNGMNRYFTDPNIKEKYEDPEVAERAGDQFSTTLESNILENMSPRGRTRPAKIVFMDSRTIVETLTTGSYEEAYRRYRPAMESWVEEGGIGRDTLERLGILESFKENIDALCDPDDRGQGYLIRQLLELIDERGPALMLRKYLLRSKVLQELRELSDQLSSFYEEDGSLNAQAVQASMRACLSFLDPRDFSSIERFAIEQLDEPIAALLPRHGGAKTLGSNTRGSEKLHGADWVARAFDAMAAVVEERILAQAQAPSEVTTEFVRHYRARIQLWRERWGYTAATMVPPDKGFSNSSDLVRHTLQMHAREILYQLLIEEQSGAGQDADGGVAPQSEEDRARARELMDLLKKAHAQGMQLCAQHGVQVMAGGIKS